MCTACDFIRQYKTFVHNNENLFIASGVNLNVWSMWNQRLLDATWTPGERKRRLWSKESGCRIDWRNLQNIRQLSVPITSEGKPSCLLDDTYKYEGETPTTVRLGVHVSLNLTFMIFLLWVYGRVGWGGKIREHKQNWDLRFSRRWKFM